MRSQWPGRLAFVQRVSLCLLTGCPDAGTRAEACSASFKPILTTTAGVCNGLFADSATIRQGWLFPQCIRSHAGVVSRGFTAAAPGATAQDIVSLPIGWVEKVVERS